MFAGSSVQRGVAVAALASTIGCGGPLREQNHQALDAVDERLLPPVSPTAPAAKPPPELPAIDGSLEHYVAQAFARSPGLRATFEEWRASVEHADRPRRLPDPELSYTFFIRHVETRVGPQRHRVSLKQWFPWPTQISAAGKAGDLMAQSQQRRFEAEALDLAGRVATVYWQLWLLDRSREVKEEERTILEALGAQVRARMEVGQADLAHLSQINLGISRAEDAIASLEEKRNALEAEMRRVIGAEPDIEVPVAADAPPMVVPTDAEGLRASAVEHPEVDAIALAAQSREEQARSERGKRFPGLGLGVSWIETGPSTIDPSMPDSGKDPVMVSATIKIPLYQRSIRAGERENEARAASLRARRVAAQQRAVADVDRTLSDLREAERRARLFTTTLVPQAETGYESALVSYQAGRSSLAEVLLAERDLIQLRHDLHHAQAEFGTKWAQLERVVGRELGGVDTGETP
jgi:outer membrane protein TolC